jgi:hypothetical protein
VNEPSNHSQANFEQVRNKEKIGQFRTGATRSESVRARKAVIEFERRWRT